VTRWSQTGLACREVVEVVNDYLEDAMPTEERASFEQHLHACPWCLTYLDQIRQSSRLAQRVTESTLPPDVEAGIRALFRARRAT
jgi:predicted anti-sigma-YlaC factor YlaD